MELAREIRTLVMIVHVADKLAAKVPGGFRLDNMNTDIDADILEELKLSSDAVAQMAEKLPERIQEVMALMS